MSTRAKLIACAAVISLTFGAVLLHVVLAQSSFELQQIHDQVVSEEAEYRRMRYEVANAEAPAKIHDAARKLGMVSPEEQRYLTGPADRPDLFQEGDSRSDEDLKSILTRQP